MHFFNPLSDDHHEDMDWRIWHPLHRPETELINCYTEQKQTPYQRYSSVDLISSLFTQIMQPFIFTQYRNIHTLIQTIIHNNCRSPGSQFKLYAINTHIAVLHTWLELVSMGMASRNLTQFLLQQKIKCSHAFKIFFFFYIFFLITYIV